MLSSICMEVCGLEETWLSSTLLISWFLLWSAPVGATLFAMPWCSLRQKRSKGVAMPTQFCDYAEDLRSLLLMKALEAMLGRRTSLLVRRSWVGLLAAWIAPLMLLPHCFFILSKMAAEAPDFLGLVIRLLTLS